MITSVSTADAGKEPSAYVETAIAARLVGRGLTITDDVELIMLYGVCVDKVAAKISIEPTLIANRSQLSQIARTPRKLGEILLPWQASLLAEAPSLKA